MKIFKIYLFLVVVFFSILTYRFFLKEHIKAVSIINDIEQLKVDSSYNFRYGNQSVNHYWIGGKYKVSLYNTDIKLFESPKRSELFIKDIGGNILITYDTKYHNYPFDMWHSDFNRLRNHLEFD